LRRLQPWRRSTKRSHHSDRLRCAPHQEWCIPGKRYQAKLSTSALSRASLRNTVDGAQPTLQAIRGALDSVNTLERFLPRRP
jgi:hypothetical protein